MDPATRQVRIYVSIPNAEEALVAGLFAEGRVATDARRAVAVPFSAVDRRGTAPVIHRIKDGKVNVVPVELGVRDEAAELIEVNSGICSGRHRAAGLGPGRDRGQPGKDHPGRGQPLMFISDFAIQPADRHRHRHGGAGGVRHLRAAQSPHRRVSRYPAAGGRA